METTDNRRAKALETFPEPPRADFLKMPEEISKGTQSQLME